MSGDPTWIFVDVSSLIQAAILLVGIARVLQMRKWFVDPTHRSRALWIGLLMAVAVVTAALTIITSPSGLAANLFTGIPFFVLLGVTFAFVDRTVLVAIKTDFFHRDIMGWMKIRLPASLVIVMSLALGLAVQVALPASAEANPPFWVYAGLLQALILTSLLLGLGAIAMMIGSRRTPDLTLRKNIRLLGLALAAFVIGIFLDGALLGVNVDLAHLIGQPFEVVATYLLYLSVMSLTPLGKVERLAGPR